MGFKSQCIWQTRVCFRHTHTHTHAHTHMHAHTHTHTCMHTHTRTHTNACLHTHTCVCTHVHTCACTHTCMHIHMHTCVPACTCVHMHTHTHVGAHTLCHLPLPSMSPNDAPAPLTTGPGSKVHFSAPRGLVGRTPRAPATSGNPVRLPGLGTSLASCPRLRERCQPGTGPGISGPHREERVTGNHLWTKSEGHPRTWADLVCSKGAAPLAEAVPDRYGKTVWSPHREAKMGPCSCRLAQLCDEPGGRGCISPCSSSLYPASGRRGPRGERTWKRSVLRPDNDFRKQRPSHGEQAVGGGGGERLNISWIMGLKYSP